MLIICAVETLMIKSRRLGHDCREAVTCNNALAITGVCHNLRNPGKGAPAIA